jgi:hypothetical protein
MKRFRFSISTLLIGTAAVASWLSVFLGLSSASDLGPILALSQVIPLCLFTWGLHTYVRDQPNAWAKSALLAGVLFLLMVVFAVVITGNTSIRFFY